MFISMGELAGALDQGQPSESGLGSSSGALMYAMAQTAQIKQALQSGDVITAISIAAGTPWNTKPTVAQVEAIVNDGSQQGGSGFTTNGVQILQKLWDSLQGPGYRSPMPNTLPRAVLQQNLAQYLAQLTPPSNPAAVKAVQQNTINVVNTSAVQAFAQAFLPAGASVPPPVVAANTQVAQSSPAAPAAPAGPSQAQLAQQLAQAQVADLQSGVTSGAIKVYQNSPGSTCLPYMAAQTLADGSQVCIDYVQARSNAIVAAAQAAFGQSAAAVVASSSACPSGAVTLPLPDGRTLCLPPGSTATLLTGQAASSCPAGAQSAQITVTPTDNLQGVTAPNQPNGQPTPPPSPNPTTAPTPATLNTDVFCWTVAPPASAPASAPAPTYTAAPAFSSAPPPSQPYYGGGGGGGFDSSYPPPAGPGPARCNPGYVNDPSNPANCLPAPPPPPQQPAASVPSWALPVGAILAVGGIAAGAYFFLRKPGAETDPPAAK